MRDSPQKPSVICFPASVSTRVSEAVDVATGQRSGAVTHLLASGRRSPEGERAVIKQSHYDTLSQEPEPVNPRVGAGEPRVPFPDSDEVGSGIGRPR
jgi:hypothetical protein